MDAAPAVFLELKAGLDVRAGGRIVAAAADAFPSGFADLDRALGGGFPRGTVATLEGAPSSGRTAILAGALAQATHTGLAAIVDDGSLYPPDLERAGVQLDRLFIVAAPAADGTKTARCADILLRSRAFGIVAMPALPLRATVWSRLCGLAQKSGAVLFVLGNANNELAYFASTRTRCAIDRVVWSGQGVLCEMGGYEINAHVVKHRRAASGATARLKAVNL